MPCGAWLVVRRSLAAGPGDPHRHDKLKHVQIAGFYPAKSLLELASHVLENATSLECLTLDTNYCSCLWRRGSNPAECYLEAIKRYFEGKIPSTSTVRLDVEGPCCGEGLDEHTPSVPFLCVIWEVSLREQGQKISQTWEYVARFNCVWWAFIVAGIVL